MTNSPIDVMVVGGAAIDYAAQGPDLPKPGTGVEGTAFHKGPGGKGANAAVAAVRLGARAALVTRVGQDEEGKLLLLHLQQEGVNIEAVTHDPKAPTGVTVLQVDQQGNKQTLSRGGSNRELTPQDVRQAISHFVSLGKPRILLAQLEVPPHSVEEAVHLARDNGINVVLDPAPARSLPESVLCHLDVITPNAKEAEALTGIEVHDKDSACQAAHQLLERGVGAAAVDAGASGKVLVWSGGWEWFPKYSVRTVDTTGAGDAFAAALAVQLAEGASLVVAARFANAAAALATTRLGAQTALPNRQRVLELLSRASL